MFARVATRALAVLAVTVSLTSRAGAVSEMACDRCTLTIAGARVVVTGKLALDPLTVDLVGYTTHWTIGALVLSDVVATARDRGDAIRACVAGNTFGSRLVACSSLPRSLERLRQLRSADVAWQLVGAGPTGQGTGHVAWTGARDITLERGHAELALPEHLGVISLGRATLAVDMSGKLAPLDLEVTGRARADTLTFAATHVSGVDLPLSLRVARTDRALSIEPHGPIVARARVAMFGPGLGLGPMRVIAPTLVVHGASAFDVGTLVNEPHVLTWSSLVGLPIDLGAGDATLRIVADGILVDHAQLAALDGTLACDPIAIRHDGAPIDVMLHARGLALARVLDTVTRGKIQGTGRLDAELALRIDHAGMAVARGTLFAPAPGVLRVRDFAWTEKLADSVMGTALHRRIATTLADFAYDRLVLDVRPRGFDPESTLMLHGHGNDVPQELDVNVNLHGMRATAHSLVSRLQR